MTPQLCRFAPHYLPLGSAECTLADNSEYTFVKSRTIFELHRRYSDKGYDIEKQLTDGIKNARNVTLYGNQFPALPEAENALVLLDHIRHHLKTGLGLRQILDFMMCVNAVKDENHFKATLLPLFEQAGLGTFARVVTKMCKKYLGLPSDVAWCDSADDIICDELLATILSSGNFGRKDTYVERPIQNISASIKTDGFFSALQKAGMINCAAFKNHRILRPFAWIYQLFRYIKRGTVALVRRDDIVGNITGDVSSGKEKAAFYKRLGIK